MSLLANIFENMLKKLTDNYAKSQDSNIGKLLDLCANEMNRTKTTLDTIELYRDIDSAEGTTLDRIGVNLGQPRNGMDDTNYRLMLKAQIKQNTSAGDINTVLEALATLINADYADIHLKETYPAAVSIKIPYSSISNNTGSIQTVGRLIENTLAAGVQLAMEFVGTLSLTDLNIDDLGEYVPSYSNITGLSDIAQTTGGSMGGVYRS